MIQHTTFHCPEAAGCLAAVKLGKAFQTWRHFSTWFFRLFSLWPPKKEVMETKNPAHNRFHQCFCAERQESSDAFDLALNGLGRSVLALWDAFFRNDSTYWSVRPSGLRCTFVGWLVCRLFGPLDFLRAASCCLQVSALLLFLWVPCAQVCKEWAQQTLTLVYGHCGAFQTWISRHFQEQNVPAAYPHVRAWKSVPPTGSATRQPVSNFYILMASKLLML